MSDEEFVHFEVLEVVVTLKDLTFVAGMLTPAHLGRTIRVAEQDAVEGVLVAIQHRPTEGVVLGELRVNPTQTVRFGCPPIAPIEFLPDIASQN